MKPSNTTFFTYNKYASRLIRGYQIADRIGATVNKGVHESCKNIVFVKVFPQDIDSIYRHYNLWFDPVDSDSMFEVLRQYPAVNVIAISRTAVDYIQARLSNRVVFLPEHHCNFDNVVIPHRPVKNIGFIGYQDCFDFPINATKFMVESLGLNWHCKLVDENTTREDVVEFYKDLDVQICFRGPRIVQGMPPEMKNPLKVVNAASFGIPTISYPEISYMREFPPFLVGKTMEDFRIHLERIKGTEADHRHVLVEKAKAYHIDYVADMYKDVLGEQ